MIRNILVQLYLFLQPLFGLGQSLDHSPVVNFGNELEECSGMTFIAPHALALINDSGNEAKLFIYDTTGNEIMTVSLLGIPNRDWESLAYADGILYIGDFGNNANSRRDLEIFKIDVSNLLTKQIWSLEGRIPFTYEDQKGFPPQDEELHFDLEAMIVERDSIFLFTKNRTKPFNGEVKVYGLSTKASAQKAKYLKSFKTNVGLKHFNWVSGASLGPNGDDLFLLGYSKLWYIENWRTSQEMKLYPYSLGYFSQKEALAIQKGELYFAEEGTESYPQSLHKADIRIFSNQYNREQAQEAILSPAQTWSSSDTLIISFKQARYYLGIKYQIHNSKGEYAGGGTIEAKDLIEGEFALPLNNLNPGSYVISLQGERKRAFRIKIL